MTDLITIFIGIGTLIIISGWWIERIVKVWYRKRQQTQDLMIEKIIASLKSIYDYLIQEIQE
jgi:hypothetical protein